MPNSTVEKLRISEGHILLAINAPADFKKKIGPLPHAAKIISEGNEYSQVHWFVGSKAQMEKEVEKVLKLLKEGVILWIYFPKGTSKMQTDLTRDKGWDKLMKHDELMLVNLISFDDTWSTFGARLKTKSDRKTEDKPTHRPVFDFVDPQTKTVRLPGDLAAALKKNRKELEFFDALSFTNKKEYIEWIVTAKREDTRSERVTGTLERLAKGWKNPRNI